MNDIQRFFAWFEGFVENIESQPTPEQWSKVKDKILSLANINLEAAAMVPQAMQTPKPAEALIRPTNATQWTAQYQGHLIELGADMETARDFVSEVTVDLSRLPRDVAKADMARFGVTA